MTRLQEQYRYRAAERHDIREQMPVLYAWARHPGARVIELGVRTGNSTAALLAAAEQAGGELWSVDIAPPQVPSWWLDLPFWHLLVSSDITPEAREFCPDGVDVLFIDTSHYFEHTLTELRAYVPKVLPGGVVLMHDTGPDWQGHEEWPDVGRALDAFCTETELQWYNHPGWPGLGVIEIPGRHA